MLSLLLELEEEELLDDEDEELDESLLLEDDYLSEDFDSVSMELCRFFYIVESDSILFCTEFDLSRFGVMTFHSPLVFC